MTAKQRKATHTAVSGKEASCRPGFTLTELLVVIALIALLVTLLLVALKHVQQKSREVSTMATMQAFSNACDAFQQEHGFYPGIVPEATLVSDSGAGLAEAPQFSGTENAWLHMMGGFAREADDPDGYLDLTVGWSQVSFDTPSGGTYLVKVNQALYGEGPVINGQSFAPYFTPGTKDFGVADGQLDGGSGLELPDLLDAWGQPIIFLRRQRSVGALSTSVTNKLAQFDPAGMAPYVKSTALGAYGYDQTLTKPPADPIAGTGSVLVTSPDPEKTLGAILGHPSMTSIDADGDYVGPARGAYMLLSAGADGIYFSRHDGPGSKGSPVDDVLADYYEDNPNIFDEYDDIIRFGGD